MNDLHKTLMLPFSNLKIIRYKKKTKYKDGNDHFTQKL